MDHEQAVQTHAPMRYALGELTAAERDLFEEHYADCSHCMNDVEQATLLAANAKAVFRDRELNPERPKTFAWLRWPSFPVLAFSGGLNLLLIAGLGLGLLRFQSGSAPNVPQSSEPQTVEIVSVHGTTRGSETPALRVSGHPVVLSFDLPQHYEHYYYSLERAGSAVRSGEVSVAPQSDTLNLAVPVAGLASGEYRVSVTGANGSVKENIGTCLLQVQTPR